MSFRLIGSAGNVSDPAVVNLFASGVIHPGGAVVFNRTSGVPVAPAAANSTTTQVFGVSLDYVQGASDAQVKVIPFADGQLWEADCVNSSSTGQVGLRHALDSDLNVRNTSTDVANNTGVFLALQVVGSTSGSGKLLGRFVSNIVPVGQNQTTFN